MREGSLASSLGFHVVLIQEISKGSEGSFPSILKTKCINSMTPKGLLEGYTNNVESFFVAFFLAFLRGRGGTLCIFP